MGSTAMELNEAQLASIADQVADRLARRPVAVHDAGDVAPVVRLPPEFYELQRESSERLARLEERVDQGFSAMEARFEQIDKRFEQVDKRFEMLIHEMDKRFEQVDKRFEQVDKRFEQVNRRFEQVDKRFAEFGRRLSGIIVLISVATAVIGGLVVLFQAI